MRETGNKIASTEKLKSQQLIGARNYRFQRHFHLIFYYLFYFICFIFRTRFKTETQQ